MFAVTISLAVRIGLLVAIPFFILGLYKITPWTPHLPRRLLYVFVPTILGLYAAGLLFVYFILLPRGMGFLLNYGTDVAVPLITINSYFEFLKALLLWVPLIFQLPLLMWLLAKTRILSYRRVNRFHGYTLTGLAVFTGWITPTVDHVNFFIMYVPMVILFESGLFLMWTINREQGDYLWIRKVRRWIVWVKLRPAVVFNKVKAGVKKVLRRN